MGWIILEAAFLYVNKVTSVKKVSWNYTRLTGFQKDTHSWGKSILLAVPMRLRSLDCSLLIIMLLLFPSSSGWYGLQTPLFRYKWPRWKCEKKPIVSFLLANSYPNLTLGLKFVLSSLSVNNFRTRSNKSFVWIAKISETIRKIWKILHSCLSLHFASTSFNCFAFVLQKCLEVFLVEAFFIKCL